MIESQTEAHFFGLMGTNFFAKIGILVVRMIFVVPIFSRYFNFSFGRFWLVLDSVHLE